MSAKLGYIFIAPALALVVLFFLTPVLMTGVYSMTNMSTATGITGGSYQITPSVLSQLGDQGFLYGHAPKPHEPTVDPADPAEH